MSSDLSTAARGYGDHHQSLRKRWRRAVSMGGVACSRCGTPFAPGEPWDLGHDDHDRSRYTGPDHRRCIRATAGRRLTRGCVATMVRRRAPQPGGKAGRPGVCFARGRPRPPRTPRSVGVDGAAGQEWSKWLRARCIPPPDQREFASRPPGRKRDSMHVTRPHRRSRCLRGRNDPAR